MCNVILLFLLFCSGNCGNNGCDANSRNSCGCRDNDRPSCGCERERSMSGCSSDNGQGCDSIIQPRNTDCGCEREKERDNNPSMTPPPWVQSNYSNGDSCSCADR